jgi:hypothetical protein
MNSTLLENIMALLIPILVALAASSGFWMFISNYKDRKSLQTELLIGLAHDRVVVLGMHYIDRGWITQDEYENLNVYLYKPYEKLGGNGSAKRIMLEVDRLPIKKNKPMDVITGEKRNGPIQ